MCELCSITGDPFHPLPDSEDDHSEYIGHLTEHIRKGGYIRPAFSTVVHSMPCGCIKDNGAGERPQETVLLRLWSYEATLDAQQIGMDIGIEAKRSRNMIRVSVDGKKVADARCLADAYLALRMIVEGMRIAKMHGKRR